MAFNPHEHAVKLQKEFADHSRKAAREALERDEQLRDFTKGRRGTKVGEVQSLLERLRRSPRSQNK